MKKTILTIVLTAVVCFAVVGTTFAWLMDSTEPITNTFTVGNVDITLTEDAGSDGGYKFKMVPGATITKNPVVTVEKDSERCWLFVKIDESDNLDTFITYAVADDWKELSGQEGVYYIDVATSTETAQSFNIIKDNTVTVNSGVTKAQLDALGEQDAVQPTLTFTAYAVQYDATALNTAELAWDQIPTT